MKFDHDQNGIYYAAGEDVPMEEKNDAPEIDVPMEEKIEIPEFKLMNQSEEARNQKAV